MPMPNDLVFVRHGQSEANIVQKGREPQPSMEIVQAINDRPDWQQRLSSLGIAQAKLAKEFIDRELGGVASFDGRFLSPFLRTRETAAYLGGDDCGEWTVDDRVVERSWGVYGTVARAEQRKQFPLTSKLHRSTPWYVRFDGGESMPDVYSRFRDFQGTLHREQSGKRVLVVSHGDFINVARYGIERMLPEQWEAIDRDPSYTIRNCSITQYSRVNPHDPTDIREKLQWRRMVYPDAIDQSPDGGQWIELPGRQRFNGAELRNQAEFAPRLLQEVSVAEASVVALDS